jgi:hypothetical protein
MRDHLVGMHHVCVLMVQIEQVDLVGQLRAIVGALLDDGDVKAARMRVYRAGAHAAGRALAADDQARHVEDGQMRHQRRALEHAGALLPDHDVVRLDRKLTINLECVRRRRWTAALGRHRAAWAVVRARLLGAEEDRDAGPARRGEQLLGRFDRAMREDSARIGILIVQLRGRQRTTTIDKVVQIDRQERRPRPDEGLAPPELVDLKVRSRNNVLPAMVVELVDRSHDCLPCRMLSAIVPAATSLFKPAAARAAWWRRR